MIPKNPRIAQKVPKNLGAPQKVPKIMAHPPIMTYASYPNQAFYGLKYTLLQEGGSVPPFIWEPMT